MAAGCRFYAGYPITPSNEIAERMSFRIAQVGGIYIQMEDELGSMAALVGASWGGAKSMTATSGPGFSLMQENIGLAAMTETPCVVVNVQRGGPYYRIAYSSRPGRCNASQMGKSWGL
ncbi:MAG: Pyruvate flavodoxin/ferredoxin oxidoreductase, thiamine diP-bdg [Candidatus Methanoperedenaceae archaeon GB50]|nr:MAG: Pyruvate flavodoxin/ferredoxin oxidoreductase, thiamine diP-bdg [Candidatus Methanoperedenaceae archaeon GB50]